LKELKVEREKTEAAYPESKKAEILADWERYADKVGITDKNGFSRSLA
jgi:hypothetical protein